MEIHYLSNDPVNYSPDASPAKFSHIGDTKCERLNLQHSATNIVLPDHNYDDRQGTFHTPKLSILLLDGSYSHLTKTFNDESHPHFSRLCFKSRRTSSQAQQVVRLKRFITKKRSNSFLTILWPITIMDWCSLLTGQYLSSHIEYYNCNANLTGSFFYLTLCTHSLISNAVLSIYLYFYSSWCTTWISDIFISTCVDE